jgi:murein DD-endopeptidase MepM/ murein hydrolase activator NlpD
MTRLALAALAAALAAGVTGAVTTAEPAAAAPPLAAPLVVPSAETPNLPGSLRLPPSWTERAGAPRTLDPGVLQQLWRNAGAAYGIPWSVLAAINKIESNLGRNMGPSSAGAVGWMQFMPDTWLRWGMDASGDGIADPWDPEDAVYAAARYLAAADGRTDIRRAVFAYNHADWYVNDVLELAGSFGVGGGQLVFAIDRASADVEEARERLARVGDRLNAALRAERRLARHEERRLAAAASSDVLSERLALERRATLAGVEREWAKRRVEALRRELAEAERELEEARVASQPTAFAAAGTPVLSDPSYSGDYVFPVGGGPSVVSVAAEHHDYPAADIAAPAGSPVYALADAVVVDAYRDPDARCGIGATMRTQDGLEWTYCHLSYLDPHVEPGQVLEGGALVGLVGSTGHSTGPHLHLQLRPANAYPQQLPWFQAFAGTAFTWQGASSDGAVAFTAVQPVEPHRVFSVVPDEPPAEPEPAHDDGIVLFSR